MNLRSISHWGCFEEPDTMTACNIFFRGDGLIEMNDDSEPSRLMPTLTRVWFLDPGEHNPTGGIAPAR